MALEPPPAQAYSNAPVTINNSKIISNLFISATLSERFYMQRGGWRPNTLSLEHKKTDLHK